MNYDGLNRKETFDLIQSIQKYLEKKFKTDIDNNILEVIIVPVQNQPTKVELLNAKYPNWEEFQKKIKEIEAELSSKKISYQPTWDEEEQQRWIRAVSDFEIKGFKK
jgi:hypothetical protein